MLFDHSWLMILKKPAISLFHRQMYTLWIFSSSTFPALMCNGIRFHKNRALQLHGQWKSFASVRTTTTRYWFATFFVHLFQPNQQPIVLTDHFCRDKQRIALRITAVWLHLVTKNVLNYEKHSNFHDWKSKECGVEQGKWTVPVFYYLHRVLGFPAQQWAVLSLTTTWFYRKIVFPVSYHNFKWIDYDIFR